MIKAIFCVLALICTWITPAHSLALNKKILILNSYHAGYPGSDDMTKGIMEALRKDYPSIDMAVEYLDSKRYSGIDFDQHVLENLVFKFKPGLFDLVVSTDDYAFNILEARHEELFGKAPVVFCGTNNFDRSRLKGKTGFLGVDEVPSFAETIELILSLHPTTTRIIAIHDTTVTGQLNAASFRTDSQSFSKRVSFEYLAGLPYGKLAHQIKSLGKDTVLVYFASSVPDGRGKYLSSTEALEALSHISPVPIYGGWEFTLGHGIIGGKLINLTEHGKVAGMIAARLLNNQPIPSDQVLPSPNQFMFDYRQMKRFGISERALPRGSTIINRPVGLYESYGREVMAGVAASLGIIVFFIALRLRKKRKEYIKDREQTEVELRKATVAAETANSAKSQFLANMSHEIRTPMNGVLGMAQLLTTTPLNAEQKEFVDNILSSGRSLMSLLNDILDLSKIEAGKVELEMRPFSLRDCIEEIVRNQQGSIQFKGLSLDIRMKDIPDAVIGDELRLKQIVLNLLGNAIKFTSNGSISISVSAIERRAGSVQIEISISDTGIGISEAVMEKIFAPFLQADGSISRHFGGTGLGLTISKRLVELMGGTVSVTSREGVGSTFSVQLEFPIVADLKNKTPLNLHSFENRGPSRRILLAEDNSLNAKAASGMLEKMGHRVTVAENGKEALDVLEKQHFDLVLMDIQMPVMGGEEALRAIRQQYDGTGKYLPVIALTAFAMDNDRKRLMGQGFDGYIPKPLELQVLHDEIAPFLKPEESSDLAPAPPQTGE